MATPYRFEASLPATPDFQEPLRELVRHALEYGGEAPDGAAAAAASVAGLLAGATGMITVAFAATERELTIRLSGQGLSPTPPPANGLGPVTVSRKGQATVYELTRPVADPEAGR